MPCTVLQPVVSYKASSGCKPRSRVPVMVTHLLASTAPHGPCCLLLPAQEARTRACAVWHCSWLTALPAVLLLCCCLIEGQQRHLGVCVGTTAEPSLLLLLYQYHPVEGGMGASKGHRQSVTAYHQARHWCVVDNMAAGHTRMHGQWACRGTDTAAFLAALLCCE